MKFVFLSHAVNDGVIKVGSHHLAAGLAEEGHEVSHVSTPISMLHIAKIRSARVRARMAVAVRPGRAQDDGVRHYVPVLPLSAASAIGSRWGEASYSRWLRTLRVENRERLVSADAVLVDQPLFAPLIRLIKPRRVVYRPTDEHPVGALHMAEKLVLAAADDVLATSEHVLSKLTSVPGAPLHSGILENGVDFARFYAATPKQSARRGFVYVGAVDARFDWDAVTQIALALPSVPIRIIGPESIGRPRNNLPSNVRILGPLPYALVPGELASARVGLLPYSTDNGNEGRSPMKFYEYLAAGLYVVGRDSAELSRRDVPGVWLYGRGREGIEQCARSAYEASSAGVNTGGIATASAFGWERRVVALKEFLGPGFSDRPGTARAGVEPS